MIEVGQTILYHVAASDENRFDFGAKVGDVISGIVTGVSKLGEINCWLFPNTAKMKPVFLEDLQYGDEPGQVSAYMPLFKFEVRDSPKHPGAIITDAVSTAAVNPPAINMPEVTGASE